jgi:hypothetical protein
MARIGGVFGIGTFPMCVQMAGGQVWYPPPGDYLVSGGSQTIFQYWDQLNLIWRNMATPIGGDPVVLSTDGFNIRMLNASGVVQGATITNAGSGATNGIGAAATGVSVSFGAAPANGVAAAAYPIVGGQIGSTITITNGGSGFVAAPLLLIDPPPAGGIQATATCTISSAGVINAVTVTNQGAGYLTVPNVYVIPQYGTYPGIGVPVNPAGAPATAIPPGALGTPQPPWFPNINWALNIPLSGGAVLTAGAITGSGTLTGLVMTNWGQGYTGTTIPTITITGAGAAAATALMSMALQSLTITAAGAAYSVANNVFDSTLGLVTAATAIINNDVVGPRCARGVAVASAGAITSTVIEDAGFGFQKVPAIGVLPAGGTPPTTFATLTAVVGGVTDVSVLQPAYNT